MLTNTGNTLSTGISFNAVIQVLNATLPATLGVALAAAGAPQLAHYVERITPTAAIFAAFLGYNPVATIPSKLPAQLQPPSNAWFPRTVAPALTAALDSVFLLAAAIAAAAAVASALRGGRMVYEEEAVESTSGAEAWRNGAEEKAPQ